MATKAKGQITIVDLNDGKALNMYITANHATTQIHNTDGGSANTSFTPNWAETALVLTPELYVTGSDTNKMTTTEVINVVWSIDGTEITTTNKGDYGVTFLDDHVIKIEKNMASPQMQVKCKCKYHDPDTDADTVAQCTIPFTKVDTAGATLTVVMTTGEGGNVWSGTEQEIQLTATLYRGSQPDDEVTSYEWYHQKNGSWEKITSEVAGTLVSGYTTKTVTIHRDFVINVDCFKCVITDTDPASSTESQTAEGVMAVYDQTDPYILEVVSTMGDTLTKGATTTVLSVELWQDGQIVSKPTGYQYRWFIYDKAGNGTKFRYNESNVLITDAASYLESKVGDTVTIHRDEISVRATIVCQLETTE